MTEEYFTKKIKEKDKIIKEYKKQNELLKKQLEYYKMTAFTDSLTKLNNRRSLENVEKYDSVILGDIDHFKLINDNFGHNIGDLVLIDIGNVFKKYIRESDLVCRWGGEEFVILLKNCNDNDAYNKAIQLKNAVSSLSDKFGFKITMSFGISNISDKTLKVAIDEADKAMYESKENGRNTITVYSLK